MTFATHSEINQSMRPHLFFPRLFCRPSSGRPSDRHALSNTLPLSPPSLSGHSFPFELSPLLPPPPPPPASSKARYSSPLPDFPGKGEMSSATAAAVGRAEEGRKSLAPSRPQVREMRLRRLFGLLQHWNEPLPCCPPRDERRKEGGRKGPHANSS